jgi:TIR domain
VTNPPVYQYDVFVSYSTQDKAWVRNDLVKKLESSGLKVCIDHRDFIPGRSNVEEIERAITTSRKILLVLTPRYLESRWAKFEGNLLQNIAPTNAEERLIPILKGKCQLPARIGHIVHVDFTDAKNLNFAWERLLKALESPTELKSVSSQQLDYRSHTTKSTASIIVVLLAISGVWSLWQANKACPSGQVRENNVCISTTLALVPSVKALPERLSNGQKTLFPDRPNPDRDIAINAFSSGDYLKAETFFDRATNSIPKDPEAEIYRNNARARQKGTPVVIAAIVPADVNSSNSYEILRGIADAQTTPVKVNVCSFFHP